jgi:hypothetical protein
MASTASNVLWTVFYHTGQFMVLRIPFEERKCLPLFSSPSRCERWMMGMRLEQHLPSAPLWPHILRRVLEAAQDVGIELVCLDPPFQQGEMFEASPIEYMLEQAESKL